MNILPYSFCRDDAEKKVLRHGFLLGVMTTAALTAPIVLLGGAVLWSMASSQISPAPPTPVSVEDAMLPAPALPQDIGADGTTKEQQVVQAVPIGQVSRAAAQVPAAARIPLPSVPAAPPVIGQTAVLLPPNPPDAPAASESGTAEPAPASVITEGVTFSDRRIAYFGGQDVPTAQTGR